MQATISESKSTRVILPKMSAQGVQQIVRLVLAQEPDAAKRIKNGVATLFGSAIFETAEVGVYLIESCSEPGTYHQASSSACSCKDHQKRGVRCRHAWALTLLYAMSAEVRFQWMQACYERNRAPEAPRYTLTPRGISATARPQFVMAAR